MNRRHAYLVVKQRRCPKELRHGTSFVGGISGVVVVVVVGVSEVEAAERVEVEVVDGTG